MTIDLNKLKELAQAATPQNLDTAQDSSTPTGYIECPHCGGDGTVELTADYLNYDGAALGVQFYGVGPEHLNAEAFFRAANPAAILKLIALAERASPAPAVVAEGIYQYRRKHTKEWYDANEKMVSVMKAQADADLYEYRILYSAPLVAQAPTVIHVTEQPVSIDFESTAAQYRISITKALHDAGAPLTREDGQLMSSVEKIEWLAAKAKSPDPQAGQDARDSALEEAAKVCETQKNLDAINMAVLMGAAAAIRALKSSAAMNSKESGNG